MAIYASGITLELREIVLRNKPDSMLEYSQKGTVPVLVLPEGLVIDESLDVMKWTLSLTENYHSIGPSNLIAKHSLDDARANQLIIHNDTVFKDQLDRYKYADRFPEHSMAYYRGQGEAFLAQLEEMLIQHQYLMSDQLSWVDLAIMPFIRQFAHVDKNWFYQAPYVHLQRWLDNLIESDIFKGVMKKYKPWALGEEPIYFPSKRMVEKI